MNPKVSVPQSLEPIKVALFGKRVFAGVIKLMILDYLAGPKCHHSVLLGGRQREI